MQHVKCHSHPLYFTVVSANKDVYTCFSLKQYFFYLIVEVHNVDGLQVQRQNVFLSRIHSVVFIFLPMLRIKLDFHQCRITAELDWIEGVFSSEFSSASVCLET